MKYLLHYIAVHELYRNIQWFIVSFQLNPMNECNTAHLDGVRIRATYSFHAYRTSCAVNRMKTISMFLQTSDAGENSIFENSFAAGETIRMKTGWCSIRQYAHVKWSIVCTSQCVDIVCQMQSTVIIFGGHRHSIKASLAIEFAYESRKCGKSSSRRHNHMNKICTSTLYCN